MRAFTTGIAAASMLAVGIAASAAGLATVRAYPLPSGGSLEMSVPMRWQEEIAWAPGEAWPRLKFRAEGEQFAVSLTTIPETDIERGSARPDRVRSLVEASARAAHGVGPGPDLLLEEFDGSQGPGWFYAVTDEAVPDPPPPGVFRVMTQGAIALRDVLLSATVLTHARTSPDLDAAIDMLRSARVSDLPGDTWRQPDPSHRDRGGVGERYTFDPPEGFLVEAASPLRARDAETNGILLASVEMRRSDVKSEMRGLAARLDRRSPDGWILRRSGRVLCGGSPAAELIAIDEHRDTAVHFVAVPREDFVLVIEWRIAPSAARRAMPRARAALEGIRFAEPAAP